MYNITIVEDEIDLRNIIKTYLENEGYNIKTFDNAEEAVKDINNTTDLYILDIMLKGDMTGYDLIKEIKSFDEDLPVIFTSARDQDIDRVLGLKMGSDDYLSKPYSPKELVLRVNNLLKRVYKSKDRNIIKINDYIINTSSREVSYEDKIIDLTSKEYDLLYYMSLNIGKAFEREELLYELWDSDYYGSDRVVDDLMRRLRKKLPKLRIETIYAFGYKLNA